jgi:hypothetical protein
VWFLKLINSTGPTPTPANRAAQAAAGRYAKAGGPPDNWCGAEIFDDDTGEKISHVVEVDCDAGWLIRYKIGANDQPKILGGERDAELETEQLEGNFRIVFPAAESDDGVVNRDGAVPPEEADATRAEAESVARRKRASGIRRKIALRKAKNG